MGNEKLRFIPDGYALQEDVVKELLGGKGLQEVVGGDYCMKLEKMGKRRSNRITILGFFALIFCFSIIVGIIENEIILMVTGTLFLLPCAYLLRKALYSKNQEPNYLELFEGDIPPEFRKVLKYFQNFRKSLMPIYRADGSNRMGVALSTKIYTSKFGLLALIGSTSQRGAINYAFLNPAGDWWLPLPKTISDFISSNVSPAKHVVLSNVQAPKWSSEHLIAIYAQNPNDKLYAAIKSVSLKKYEGASAKKREAINKGFAVIEQEASKPYKNPDCPVDVGDYTVSSDIYKAITLGNYPSFEKKIDWSPALNLF